MTIKSTLVHARLMRLLSAMLIASVVLSGAATVALADTGWLASQIEQVRGATGQYQDIATAQTAGYAKFLGCIDEPGQGGMGIHYVNSNLAGDTVLDPQRPEALVYEPGENGQLKLVALEYIVFQVKWDGDGQSNTPPKLFGQTFNLVGSPNRYGLPAFYELHVWAWKNNPSGVFYEWNPDVSCAAITDRLNLAADSQ
jgi:hypothetical protein